ncbi:HAD family hydrolase [Cellulomonas bogoriensis]
MLLDIDDTLVDTRGAFEAALGAIVDRYLPGARGREAEVLAAWRADVAGHYRSYTRGEVDHRTQRMARANELHATFGGPPLDEEAYQEWDQLFEERFSGAWRAHPDAAPALEALTRAGLRLGALTNAATAYQEAKLARTGLDRWLGVLVGVDTLGVGKPHPRVFTEACARLGTEPAATVYVGDELDVDAVAAVAAGLRGVWLDRPGPRRVGVEQREVGAATERGVEVVTDLGRLPDLVLGFGAPAGLG